MVLTDDFDIFNNLKQMRNLDFTGTDRFNHNHFYWNYRLGGLQAALGISQLKRLDHYVTERNKIAKKYDEKFKDIACINSQLIHENIYSAFHLYIIRIDDLEIKKNHKEIFIALREKDIGVNIHYIPVHFHPYYKKLGFEIGDFPNAENYYYSAISIPLFFGLQDEEQSYVISKINNYFK